MKFTQQYLKEKLGEEVASYELMDDDAYKMLQHSCVLMVENGIDADAYLDDLKDVVIAEQQMASIKAHEYESNGMTKFRNDTDKMLFDKYLVTIKHLFNAELGKYI